MQSGQSKKVQNRGFKTSADGKLIISDLASDDEDNQGGRKFKTSRRIPTVSDSESGQFWFTPLILF